MNKALHLSAILLLAATLASAAQESHPAKQKDVSVSIINHSDADSTDVARKFRENAPVAFNIPNAPRFAIVGKNRSFYLGIGGQVKGTLSYDFGTPIDNANEFATSSIPMNPAPGNGGKIQFSAMQSGLFVNMVALPDNPNSVGAYINFNLVNGNYGFNIVYAYLKYRGFTVGYDYSLFSDMAAVPPTIDYEGPCGLTAIPNGVLDYRHTFGKHFGVGIGLEMPIASYTDSRFTTTVSQRVPDIPAYLQYSFSDNSRIRLSAILRNMTYRDLTFDRNRNAVGYGFKLSGTMQLLPNLTAYYQAAYGKGITSYFQDLFDGGLDMVPDASCEGKLSTVKSWGGYIGLQYNFSPKWYASGTFSYLRNYAPRYSDSDTPWSSQYKYARYAVCNLFYNINSMLSWGLEYIWGSRTDMSGLTRHDNRLQTMFQVSF